MRISIKSLAAAGACLAAAACGQSVDEDSTETLTIYSARHYDSDRAVYQAFEDQTGIQIETIEAGGDLLIERMKADGERSGADVVITVDAGRLWRAEQDGLFQPYDSEIIEERVPESLRHPEGKWFGFAKRARVIAYSQERGTPDEITGYETLADPKWDNRVCVRSSGNIYNISLLAALIERWGDNVAQDWAQGVVRNFARVPSGGDIEQIRAIAAGECDLALVNHYYYARIANSEDAADQEVADAVALNFPEDNGGVHVNISGAGVAANADNVDAAHQFLEFLLSDEAQRMFAELTNEYPVVASAPYENDVLDGFGEFEADPVNVNTLGENQAEAQRMFDRVGWP